MEQLGLFLSVWGNRDGMKLSSNIRKLYVANFLTGLVFWYGIEKLFMQHIGIGSFGVAINAVVILVITLLLDVPAGVLADQWKRKYVLIIAMVCLTLATLVYALSTNIMMYLSGSVLYGFYLVTSSGTFQAITYDSLLTDNQQELYSKHQGRSYGMFLLGASVSSVIGGFLAHAFGFQAVFLISMIPGLLNILIISDMVEPAFHRATFDSKLREHITASVKTIVRKPLTLHLALLMIVSGIIAQAWHEFDGLLYVALNFTAISAGLASAGLWLFGAAGQFGGNRVGYRRAMQLVPVLFGVFLIFSLIKSSLGLAIFFAVVAINGLVNLQAETCIQGEVDSSLRATSISLISFGTNVILVPLSLLFGWISQQFGIYWGFRFFATIGLGYLIFWFSSSRKLTRVNPVQRQEPAQTIATVKG